MRIQTTMKILFFILAALLVLPAAAQASVSIACICTDNDDDGYGYPGSENCEHPEEDCDDICCDDPPECATCTCGTVECGPCARCINPGAVEVCDGKDNDCDGLIDEEPEASASCDDGVSCTVDTCNPDTHLCEHTPDDGLCDDGLWCNGAETCDPVADCQAGTDPCPDDGAFCNGTESCDEENDQCVSSGNPCADDGNPCTDDVCNEVDDTCEYLCNASGYEDPCCEDPACESELICKVPVCGDGVIDPGEECGEPGLDACPPDSPFCVDCQCSPIAITLDYFRASGGDGFVLVEWGTGSEEGTAGFNILRSEDEQGPFAAVNESLIPGQGNPSQGAEYSYTDTDVVNGTVYWYKLQEVETDGDVNEFDPVVSATPQAAAACAAASAEAATVDASGAAPLATLYPVGLPLFAVGLWLTVAVYRRRR